MKSHWIWMIIGCGIPLLLIFFAPALGITGYNGLFAFIILMFAIHLIMPSHHGRHKHGSEDHADHNDEDKGHEHGKEKLTTGDKENHKAHEHH